MSSFIEELWSSIFIPGPTPTLLVATNVAFGALQFLLLALLIATYSVHFVVLSVLCAGLWWSINWFSAELQLQAARDEAATEAGGDKGEREDKAEEELVAKEENKNEKEIPSSTTATAGKTKKSLSPSEPTGVDSDDTETESVGGYIRPPPAPVRHVSAATLKPGDGPDDGLRRRRSLGDGSSGYISTDSEWEKVDEGDEKKR